MHTHTVNFSGDPGSDLLLEVDFKWLMAGQGYTVDPDRLLHDPAYADTCLQCAQHSNCIALQDCALNLREVLAHTIH
ncbi:hypothetical protein os1_26770 [Comamonadaceae bacterium OS-1]|nr:hypothetical protein os1_26770 [Comamonadaceae bacterium OS-1]